VDGDGASYRVVACEGFQGLGDGRADQVRLCFLFSISVWVLPCEISRIS
jgi:hypothetical protein